MPNVVYHRNYNIGLYGLERLHPFDSRKYGKAWRAINLLASDISDTDDGILNSNFFFRRFKLSFRRIVLRKITVAGASPMPPVPTTDLQPVHNFDYLESFRDPKIAAAAIGYAALGRLPKFLL